MNLPSKAFWDSLAQWFSAIGTVGAVIVALYLARQQNKPKLVLHSGIKKLVVPGIPQSDDRDHLHLAATNLGTVDVKVTHLVWRLGRFKKTTFIQIATSTPTFRGLPTRIPHGESADLIFPIPELKLTDSPIVADLKRVRMLGWRLRTLQFGFHTSVGITFWQRPDARIIELYRSYAKKA